jgi:DNA-binding transcriptional MerR regulator
MLKIGDLYKLSQVSVKTLRYYDEVGLLKPSQVDRFTGYRYYSIDQIPRLNRILAFKDLGLSLEQIGRLLDEDLPPSQIRGMLRMKQAEIQDQLLDEQARLRLIEARLRQIELEDSMPTYDIVLKKVDPQKVISIRDTLPTFGDQIHLWIYFGQLLDRQESQLPVPRSPSTTTRNTANGMSNWRQPRRSARPCQKASASK